MSSYAGDTRDNVVKAISQHLDWLAEGIDPAVTIAAAEAEATATEAGEGEEEPPAEATAEAKATPAATA